MPLPGVMVSFVTPMMIPRSVEYRINIESVCQEECECVSVEEKVQEGPSVS